jgi:hypothetical protein
MLFRKLNILFLFAFFCKEIINAQNAIDISAYRTLSNKDRFNFMVAMPFYDWDSITATNTLNQFLPIVQEKKDIRSELFCNYIKFILRGKFKFSSKELFELLNGMEQKAKKNGFTVEEAVALHYLNFERYYAKEMSVEQQYVAILKNFELMQSLGFDEFKPYRIQAIMMHIGNFMRDLEDQEKAFQYFTIAEHYTQPIKDDNHYYTMIMNNIQMYYNNKKDYAKAIEYAKKIYDFHHSLNPTQDYSNWKSRFWQGLTSLDIAKMYIEMGKLNEGEQYSIQGYELCKVSGDVATASIDKIAAEFDALQVIIAIKLKLGKIEDAKLLIDRVELLRKYVDFNSITNYFKPLKLYHNYAKYYEAKHDLTNAFRYTKMANVMQDSLDRRNDAHKLEKIKQRLDAEKYTTQISLIEEEKKLQQWLKNAAIVILLLGGGLAFVNYRRIQHKRKLDLQALKEAKDALTTLTNNYREKSELADNLRTEMERLSHAGEHSEYLQQLTNSTILTDEDWQQFRLLFEKVHPRFIQDQKTQFPDLTSAELRLLVLEKLNLTTQEMANMLGVSRNTINQTKVRLRKKIG